jgi:2-succinyl-6-hydroxy-2,4-cyclohexadiene-1-carboxylate synthase
LNTPGGPVSRTTVDLILLHGFTGSSASWGDRLVDGLASAGVSPVLVDLPGHGRHVGQTDPAGFTLDAACLSISAAGGPEPVPLLGYSMGGRLALAYAVRHPGRISRLILESASPGLEEEASRRARRASDEELALRLESWGMEAFVEHWESLPIFSSQRGQPPEVRHAHRARRLKNDALSLAAALRGLGTGTLPSCWDALETLDVPTLLIVGELDSKFHEIALAMAGRLPEARVAVVGGAGHAVHVERPEAWLGAVLDFLV